MGRHKKSRSLLLRGSGSDSGSDIHKKSRLFGPTSGSDRDNGSDIRAPWDSESKRIRRRALSRYKSKRSEDVKHYEFKDMRKLESNDEAFFLSWRDIRDITRIISSQKTPTSETFMQWDEYEASFYLKMCAGFGVDPHRLEAENENEKKQLLSASESNNEPVQVPLDTTPKVISHIPMECTGVEKTQPSKKEECFENELFMEFESDLKNRLYTKLDELKQDEFDILKTQLVSKATEEDDTLKTRLVEKVFHTLKAQLFTKEVECLAEEIQYTGLAPRRCGPMVTGHYTSGKEPGCIPYQLFLLVKEAAGITKYDDPDDFKLQIVEEKIRFFCTYFYSHLPKGWEYEPGKASSIIVNYDHMSAPKDLMADFTRYEMLDDVKIDRNTKLTEQNMAGIMGMVHSRKKPIFTELAWMEISFYC